MSTTGMQHSSRQGYREAEAVARDRVCGDCQGELVVRWGGDAYRAECARDDMHEHVVSRREIARDDIRRRVEAEPRLAHALAVQGARVPLTTRAIGDLSQEQLQSRVDARFAGVAEATPAVRAQIVGLAKLYRLDPLFDMTLYEGRPYVTYEGRLRKLREAPGYQGHVVRPLGRAELEAWGYATDDLVVQCDVDMGPHGTVTDWGVVRREEIDRALARARETHRQPAPVGGHPQQIALKRAIARASRQAVGVDLPTLGIEDDAVSPPPRVTEVRTVPPGLPDEEDEVPAERDELPAAAVWERIGAGEVPAAAHTWALIRDLEATARSLGLDLRTIPARATDVQLVAAARTLRTEIAARNAELDQQAAAESAGLDGRA